MAWLSGWIAVALVALVQPLSFAAESEAVTQINAQTRNQGKGVALPIAQNGKACLDIEISKSASNAVKSVATELSAYLKRITGADFKVAEGDGSKGIVVGTLKDFPDQSLDEGLKIFRDYDGKEAFAIRTSPQRLQLIGATDLGVSHAAFRFLELLGCRWFFPTKEWEVIPAAPSLSFNQNLTDRPEIWSRSLWYAWGCGGFEPGDISPAQALVDWKRHNLMAQSLQVEASHSYEGIRLANKEAFAAHPEYTALTKGKREGQQFCVTNPDVQKIVVDYAIKYLTEHPDADMVAVDTADGEGYCECDNCKKLGKPSNQAFYMANIVAKAVREKFPKKMVGLYAYNWHSEPPDFALEPNVYVLLTAGFIRGKYSYDELLEMWPKVCKNMGYYEYFSTWYWDHDYIPGGRAASPKYLKKQIALYARQNGTSISAESGNNWGVHGPGYYLASKLMWNSQTSVREILDDFYLKAFGPAAAEMQKYYELVSPDSGELMGVSLLARAFQHVAAADAAARFKPAVSVRLNDLKMYLHAVVLAQRIAGTDDKNEAKRLTLESLTHAFRMRNRYMTHWSAIWQAGTREASNKFNEKSWMSDAFPGNGPTWPWKDKSAITQAEIDKNFQADLKWLPKPVEVKELSYSKDLVPVVFQKDGEQLVTDQYFEGAVCYAMYSSEGHPLDFSLYQGVVHQDLKAGKYILRDAQGKVITQAEVANGDNQLSLPVPGAGLYYFDFDDQGAGWKPHFTGDFPVSLVIQKGNKYVHHGMLGRKYFYVPAGTTAIDILADPDCNTIQILNPEGKIVKEAKCEGQLLSIPTSGQSGRLWSMGGSTFNLGSIWIYNAPNLLSTSKDTVLVPRDVAEKDKLLLAE